jgi:hypothetical protein
MKDNRRSVFTGRTEIIKYSLQTITVSRENLIRIAEAGSETNHVQNVHIAVVSFTIYEVQISETWYTGNIWTHEGSG